jgi:hypothetical protein
LAGFVPGRSRSSPETKQGKEKESSRRISGEEMIKDGIPTPDSMEAGHPILPQAEGNFKRLGGGPDGLFPSGVPGLFADMESVLILIAHRG